MQRCFPCQGHAGDSKLRPICLRLPAQQPNHWRRPVAASMPGVFRGTIKKGCFKHVPLVCPNLVLSVHLPPISRGAEIAHQFAQQLFVYTIVIYSVSLVCPTSPPKTNCANMQPSADLPPTSRRTNSSGPGAHIDNGAHVACKFTSLNHVEYCKLSCLLLQCWVTLSCTSWFGS